MTRSSRAGMMNCAFSWQCIHFMTNVSYGSLKRMKRISLDDKIGKNDLCLVCSTHGGDTKYIQNVSRKTCGTHRDRGAL